MKGVEVGLGFAAARLPGSQVHDPLAWDERRGYHRTSNRSGGVEGGISTGEPIVLRVAMKPISTLRSPLRTVELGIAPRHRVPLRARRRVRRAGGRHRPRGRRRAGRWPTPCSSRFGGATVADVVGAVARVPARAARGDDDRLRMQAEARGRSTSRVRRPRRLHGLRQEPRRQALSRAASACRSSTPTRSSRPSRARSRRSSPSAARRRFARSSDASCWRRWTGSRRVPAVALAGRGRGERRRRPRGAARRALRRLAERARSTSSGAACARAARRSARRAAARWPATRPPSGSCTRSACRCTARSRRPSSATTATARRPRSRNGSRAASEATSRDAGASAAPSSPVPRAYDVVVERGALGELGHRRSRCCAPRARSWSAATRTSLRSTSTRRARACATPASRVSQVVIPAGESEKNLDRAAELYGVLYDRGIRRGDVRRRARRRRRRRPRRLRRRDLHARRRSGAGADHAARPGRRRRSGGKVAVDFRAGKNYVGTFYQPLLVVADPDTLATLPARELRSGAAEVAKYGFLAGGRAHGRGRGARPDGARGQRRGWCAGSASR